MTELRILSGADVDDLLTYPRAIAAMREAMRDLSSGRAEAPLRGFIDRPAGAGSLGWMPAAAASGHATGIKLLTITPANPARGLPAIQGCLMLFDSVSGAPAALMDGAAVTAIRTAAVSALASLTLASADCRSHGILGSGVQARSHALAMLAAFPDLECTLIYGRNAAAVESLVQDLRQSTGRRIEVAQRELCCACDLVSAVTSATEPLIFRSEVAAGAHVNLVGSHLPDAREACTDLIAAARVFVDSRSAALREAGDLVIPMREGRIDERHLCGELGDVLAGRSSGRRTTDDLTVYKSLGNAVQDLYAGRALLAAAEAAGRGALVAL